MWTNVFKLPGFNQLSWFQYLPHELELLQLPDKSSVKDAATKMVLSAHLQLQKEELLSTWTNSFVGPWDPSQGFHNPDEKIKLWLFLPGRYSTVTDSAQVAVSKLRVVASGVWISPGDSEEVATALSQALRNRIERSLYINKSKVLGVKFTMFIFDNYFIGIYRVLSGFAYMRDQLDSCQDHDQGGGFSFIV